MIRCLLGLALFTSFVACAAQDDAGTSSSSSSSGEASSSGEVPRKPGPPRYQVPVPAELEPWSWYAVPHGETKIDRGRFKAEYKFPVLLNGTAVSIRLEGTYTAGATVIPVTIDPAGTGECTLNGAIWSCREEFTALPIDRDAARIALQEAGLSAFEVDQRMQVTDRFSVDPIGIYEFSADSVDIRDD